MDVLNRSVAIIRPKQAYLDWIHTLPGSYYETLEDLREQSRAVPGQLISASRGKTKSI